MEHNEDTLKMYNTKNWIKKIKLPMGRKLFISISYGKVKDIDKQLSGYKGEMNTVVDLSNGKMYMEIITDGNNIMEEKNGK